MSCQKHGGVGFTQKALTQPPINEAGLRAPRQAPLRRRTCPYPQSRAGYFLTPGSTLSPKAREKPLSSRGKLKEFPLSFALEYRLSFFYEGPRGLGVIVREEGKTLQGQSGVQS